jgi:hypothetical protein
MRSTLSRAPVRSSARSDLLERQFKRYCPHHQGAVRALASRHSRIADLALSFPTLLFALAAPRHGFDPAWPIARTIAGARLAEVAAAADVPMWLRRLPPEALVRPIGRLPDSKPFRLQIANHLPPRKLAPIWLGAVADAAELADDAFAIWIAREMVRDMRSVKLKRLRLVGLWAWFSGQPGTFAGSLMRKCWTPDIQFEAALAAADDWHDTILLYVNLGREPITDLWLRPAHVCGYDFRPLVSVSEIADEALAMSNCVRRYGEDVAHNRSRLWSVRKDGQRAATLDVALCAGGPLPGVVQLKGAANSKAPFEVWWAARQWLNLHDLSRFDPKLKAWGSANPDRATWLALWRPYWLAKRRFPEWLPLAPALTPFKRL